MMNAFRLLFFAALCLAAPAARCATLSYTSAYRYLESGLTVFESFDRTGDMDRGVAGLDSTAAQRSVLGTAAIVVSSRISGLSERGAAFFLTYFSLDEPSEWNLHGTFELLATTGFACVSFLNLAHRDVPLILEIISAPPWVSETRTLQFGGVLEAGDYLLEAMIYGGGDNQTTRGGIDAVFTIPEPGAPLLLMMVLLFRVRRRR